MKPKPNPQPKPTPRAPMKTFPELLREATPGVWDAVSVPNADAEYGDGGPDPRKGFDAYAVMDSAGRPLFDTLNRDTSLSLIEDEEDENGVRAWDVRAERDAAYIARCNPATMTKVWDHLTRINALCNNPHWTADRRERIEELSCRAIAALNGGPQ